MDQEEYSLDNVYKSKNSIRQRSRANAGRYFSSDRRRETGAFDGVRRSGSYVRSNQPVRSVRSTPQIPRLAEEYEENRERNRNTPAEHRPVIGPLWDEQLLDDGTMQDNLLTTRNEDRELMNEVFSELDSVVTDAEEEAMLLNQGPNSSSGKRARVLAMGVPESLYDELYEQGYFDSPAAAEPENVKYILKQYYAREMTNKILRGEIEYSQLQALKEELECKQDDPDEDLCLTKNMREILNYIDFVIKKINQ